MYYPALSNFSSPIYLASGSKSSSFVATDLNNDQKLDLAYANVYSKDIGVTLNSISLIYPNTPYQLVCNGDSVLLYITDTVPGFTWSNGSTNDSIYVSNPGWYYVTAPPSVLGQCFSSSRVFVQTHSVTAPVFSTLNNPDTVCVNQIAALSATPAGGTFSGPGVLNNQFNPASLTAGMSYTVSYMYIDSIGCSSLPVSISIYVDLCTGITETENEKIKLFPNPAMNKIEINQGQILFYDRLEVFDMFGRVIDARVIDDVILNLSLQELVSGTYQFRFTNSSNKFPSFSKKVLILH
ncbi:MAG: T9SS type A sorting domain-containing protein [Bacteroidetes bacterium]|nr:T9SS type A sorting domain-containing protein [Bacteroidota bacterium]